MKTKIIILGLFLFTLVASSYELRPTARNFAGNFSTENAISNANIEANPDLPKTYQKLSRAEKKEVRKELRKSLKKILKTHFKQENKAKKGAFWAFFKGIFIGLLVIWGVAALVYFFASPIAGIIVGGSLTLLLLIMLVWGFNSGKHTSTRLYFLEEKKDPTKKRLIAVEVNDLTKKASKEAIASTAKSKLSKDIDLNNYVITKETLHKKYKVSYLTAKLVDEGTDKNQITELVCNLEPVGQIQQPRNNISVSSYALDVFKGTNSTVTYVLQITETSFGNTRTFYEVAFVDVKDQTDKATESEIKSAAQAELRRKIPNFSITQTFYNYGKTANEAAKLFNANGEEMKNKWYLNCTIAK